MGLHRVGLLPRVARPRRHVTPQKQKQPQPPAPAPVAAVKLRPLRVLRPRQAAAFDSDDSDEDSLLNGLDSPTSSSSTLSVSHQHPISAMSLDLALHHAMQQEAMHARIVDYLRMLRLWVVLQ